MSGIASKSRMDYVREALSDSHQTASEIHSKLPDVTLSVVKDALRQLVEEGSASVDGNSVHRRYRKYRE